ncbi:MAG: hypothetical protein H3C42_15970 [Phycisphaerae bacterium]|nr:hypothetical protein [Phycisphaerae bacterium]
MTAIAGWIGWAVVSGTLLALVTWVLVRWPLRRVHPGIHGALWLIVLLKFLLPAGPAFPASLATLAERGARQLAANVAPAGGAATGSPVAAAPLELRLRWIDAAPGVAAAATPAQPAAPGAGRPWLNVLVGLYLAAVCGIGLWRLRGYWRFVRGAARLPRGDAATERGVAEICRRVGVRAPRTVVSDTAPAPCIFGVWRPVLVLSRRQLDCPAELEAAVLHEIAHIRRCDLLVRHVQWLTGTLLFFWPVVAWVNRRIDWARECACDEWALRHGGFSASQYARCLLRAAQPAGPRWTGFAPAAMAANPSLIERRIEVILNSSNTSASRWVGPAVGALLVGWAGFVLTGASAADKPAAQDTSTTEERVQTIVVHASCVDGVNEDFVVETAALPMPMFGLTPFAFSLPIQVQVEGDGIQGATGAMAIVAHQEPADFAQRFPAADANGDGVVTPEERDAYVIARAMLDPAGVLAQFPHADRDGNGKLSADEAARLVCGAMMLHRTALRTRVAASGEVPKIRAGTVIVRKLGEGEPEVIINGEPVDVQTVDAEPGAIRVRRITRTDAAGGEPVELELKGRVNFTTAGGQAPLPPLPGLPPSTWIIHNTKGEPSAADVAAYVELARETSSRTFLERHPEADLNKDGRVSAEEREAFIERQMATLRQKLLERHPEADLDGDGALSIDEMRQFHMNMAAGLKGKVEIEAGPGQRVIVVERETDEPR